MTKQSDSEALGMPELWGMQLPGPLWARLVAHDRVLSMAQIEMLDIQTVYLL